MSTKKIDPEYTVLRGHVPKELFKRFKMYAVDQDMNNSEALESLLREHFDPNGTVPVKEGQSVQN